MHLMVLGASRQLKSASRKRREDVSMHLMVLGASRPWGRTAGRGSARRVSMHLMVLGASRPRKWMYGIAIAIKSQCT